jgi:hypothetical protein
VHDDLTDEVRARHGTASDAFRLTRELMVAVARDPHRVYILTLREQLDALVGRGPRRPFELAAGIGRAGERVARQVHARTGWFPAIARVDLTREEDGGGGYRLACLEGVPLELQLRRLGAVSALAVVDDTVFSGLTLETVLRGLPADARARTEVLCLRGAGESVRRLAALCPVTVGFEAEGRLLVDVSFINASGLVRRGSIRRAGRPPLAFFERPEWMKAWFPAHAEEVIARCRALRAALASPGARGRSRDDAFPRPVEW